MLLVKSALWVVVYPFILFGYGLSVAWEVISFLFHSPVDVWSIISKSIDEAQGTE